MTRRRKWLVRAALGVLGLGVLGAGGTYALWARTRAAGEAKRDEAVRALDAADPGWRIDELCAERNSRLPPGDRNAAVQLVTAQRLIPKAYNEWLVRPDHANLTDLRPPFLPDADTLRGMTEAHAACADVLAKLRAVRTLPDGGTRLVMSEPNTLSTLLPHIQPIRACAAVLALDAAVLAAGGRADDAVDSARAIHRCARALGDEPTVIAQLVRIAIVVIAVEAVERTLGWSEPATNLEALQAELAAEIPVPRLAFGFRGERGSFYRLLDGLDRGQLTLEQLTSDSSRAADPGLKARVMLAWYRQHIPDQQAKLIDLYNALLAADRLPGPERLAALARVRESLPPRTYENLLVVLLTPGFEKMSSADDRVRSHLGCAVAAVACERYRLRYRKWPATLAEVPKDFLPTLPEDPFVGGGVRYRLTADGVVVYTTGPDRVDDGGETLDPKGTAGTDLGFRLFNPDRRRRPAPPRPPDNIGGDGHGLP